MFVCVCVCVLVLIVCQQVATKGTYKCISVAAILACAPPPPPPEGRQAFHRLCLVAFLWTDGQAVPPSAFCAAQMC